MTGATPRQALDAVRVALDAAAAALTIPAPALLEIVDKSLPTAAGLAGATLVCVCTYAALPGLRSMLAAWHLCPAEAFTLLGVDRPAVRCCCCALYLLLQHRQQHAKPVHVHACRLASVGSSHIHVVIQGCSGAQPCLATSPAAGTLW